MSACVRACVRARARVCMVLPKLMEWCKVNRIVSKKKRKVNVYRLCCLVYWGLWGDLVLVVVAVCVRVCARACARVCVCVCVCVYARACEVTWHLFIIFHYAHARTDAHTVTHIHTNTPPLLPTHTPHTHTHTHTGTHTHAHTHSLTHTHTHTRTHAHTGAGSRTESLTRTVKVWILWRKDCGSTKRRNTNSVSMAGHDRPEFKKEEVRSTVSFQTIWCHLR